MRDKILYLILFFIFSFFISFSYAAKSIICNGVYALCAYAKCIPIPGEKGKALCACEVKSGYSIGSKNCQADASINSDGYKTLASRYYPIKLYVRCHNNRAWANCYNSQCIINPQKNTQAFCTCSTVKNKGDYMYATDSCDVSGCDASMISSYVVKDAVKDYESLKNVVNYNKLPTYIPKPCFPTAMQNGRI